MHLWILISLIVAALAGTASAAFIAALDWATHWREGHLWVISLLPLCGLAVGWVYHRYGRALEGGNNLIIDEIHDQRARLPLRMAPLIFGGTIATHLFGGSAGREGTAVQMGASLADQLEGVFKLSSSERRILLMAGVSAGFGSVFGTPVAGAVFGLEFITLGRMQYEAILPCFLASILGNEVAMAWGVTHATPPPLAAFVWGWSGIPALLLAGALFGFLGRAFAWLTHAIGAAFRARIRLAPVRPLVGGIAVALAVWGLGTSRYIGIGDAVIAESLSGPVPVWDFLAKMLFTSVTLGSGFVGGEVTPLFFMGATFGNALSHVLPLPLPVLSSVGFVAVFGGAANVPITATILAFELFGPPIGAPAALACVMSYLCSGHSGIYSRQRLGVPKFSASN